MVRFIPELLPSDAGHPVTSASQQLIPFCIPPLGAGVLVEPASVGFDDYPLLSPEEIDLERLSPIRSFSLVSGIGSA